MRDHWPEVRNAHIIPLQKEKKNNLAISNGDSISFYFDM